MNRRREPEPDPQRLISAHHSANEFYRFRLQSELRAVAYLHTRGIIAATAHTPPWTIGYAPRGWTHLHDHLRNVGYTDRELLAAGLVTTTSTGNLIDVFRNRVMFPIRNPDGHIVAFTGRDLSARANTPKYRNTTATAIYSKKHLLYGLTEQLGGDTPPATVMLVEGPADVVAIARLRQPSHGDTYRQAYAALAPCGTALTAEQIAQLTDAVPPGTPLIVAFDPDTAGRAAIDKSYKLLRDWPGPVDAIALPMGTDPADLVAQGRENAATALEQARRPLADLLIDQRLTRFRLDEIPGRFAALHAIAPLIADVATRDVRHAARLSAHLAKRLNLNPLTVFEAIFPPTTDTAFPSAEDAPDNTGSAVPPAETRTDSRPDPRTAIPLGGPGFPHPGLVGHEYARTCPPTTPATTWVQHDATTGRTAWILAEGVADTPGDRYAARLAAEVAGRAAVLVGAHKAIDIARTAVNAHFAQPDTGRGDAAITVLTYESNQSGQDHHRLTIAWAGDIKAFGSTGRWFAPLTTDRTTHGAGTASSNGVLTASVRGGAIGVNHIHVPLTQIVLMGRALTRAAPESIRRAVEWRKPASAVAHLVRLNGPSVAAMIVRPRPDQASHIITAAQLARQDRAPNAATRSPVPLPQRAARRALPAAPLHHQPTR